MEMEEMFILGFRLIAIGVPYFCTTKRRGFFEDVGEGCEAAFLARLSGCILRGATDPGWSVRCTWPLG
jgi:hypothetical protein